MGNKRHKPGEIVAKLRQVEVHVGQDVARGEAIREVRIGSESVRLIGYTAADNASFSAADSIV